MSLHYILDGYNIIHQIEAFGKGSLEENRNHLIRYIEQKKPQGSSHNEVTIVFDGRSDVYGGEHFSFVKVIFSKDETADDKIKRIVTQSSLKGTIVVVTNDRDIQFSVKAMGAKISTVEAFFYAAGRAPRPKDAKLNAKNIPTSVEFKITDELKKIWVKDKEKNK